jgi:hypothetical protein
VAVARNDFDGAAVLATDLPVVVVQSTEDAFVSPKNAAVFQVTPRPYPGPYLGLYLGLYLSLSSPYLLRPPGDAAPWRETDSPRHSPLTTDAPPPLPSSRCWCCFPRHRSSAALPLVAGRPAACGAHAGDLPRRQPRPGRRARTSSGLISPLPPSTLRALNRPLPSPTAIPPFTPR